MLHVESLPSAVVSISQAGEDSLLVYTYENILYHFIVQVTKDSVKITKVGQIYFHGIVRSPARVRAISWILPEEQTRSGDPSQDVAVATVVFLVDGKLVMLQPTLTEDGDAKYDMRTLKQNVEYYALMRNILCNIISYRVDQILGKGRQICTHRMEAEWGMDCQIHCGCLTGRICGYFQLPYSQGRSWN